MKTESSRDKQNEKRLSSNDKGEGRGGEEKQSTWPANKRSRHESVTNADKAAA